MSTLTIFTPVYNRAHTIGRTYESLCRQTCDDFEWLVVDDGSSDNTKELINGWIAENKIAIRYIYQQNQGMHGAHNTAYKNINTELNTCVDSDDYMPDDAVEKIVSFWKKYGSDRVAGVIGLDMVEDGSIIGAKFPDYLKETTLRDYYETHHGSGDKKLVYRTDVITKYPEYPIFEGEKYVGLAYKYNLIDEDYSMLTLNEPLVVVEYQDDGSSRGMWKQYWNNPRGFAFFRINDMKQTKSLKRKVMSNIHYVSHSIRSKNRQFLQESPTKILTLLCFVPGCILYYITKRKVQANTLYGK